MAQKMRAVRLFAPKDIRCVEVDVPHIEKDTQVLIKVKSCGVCGSVARLAKAAVDRAREAGIKAGLVRPVTLWPFPVQEVREACRNAKRVLCVEMSM